jgi:hypothetical protein
MATFLGVLQWATQTSGMCVEVWSRDPLPNRIGVTFSPREHLRKKITPTWCGKQPLQKDTMLIEDGCVGHLSSPTKVALPPGRATGNFMSGEGAGANSFTRNKTTLPYIHTLICVNIEITTIMMMMC